MAAHQPLMTGMELGLLRLILVMLVLCQLVALIRMKDGLLYCYMEYFLLVMVSTAITFYCFGGLLVDGGYIV